MYIALWAIVWLVVWMVLGAAVLAWFDRDERLFRWAQSGPFGTAPVMIFWPVVLYFFLRKSNRLPPNE